MKRVSRFLFPMLAVLLLISLTACGETPASVSEDTGEDSEPVQETVNPAEEAGIDEESGVASGTETHTNPFDFDSRTVLLNDGREMPLIGIGTFTLSDEQAEESVYQALTRGYHLIDTASAYGNETGVGRGIQRAIEDGFVTREEIFVTTKLWPQNYNMDGIDAALERLNLDYIDLLLLHQPMGDYIGGYQAMEQAVAEGKVRSIGVSNFSTAQFEEIMAEAVIPPPPYSRWKRICITSKTA